MALRSLLFKDDQELNACAIHDASHVTPGSSGDHVAKIQLALRELDTAAIDKAELSAKHYGASTAKAVLAYKTKRSIINHSYETVADNIVGKMTIASLDREMLTKDGSSCRWPTFR
jgi:hypothetical protein